MQFQKNIEYSVCAFGGLPFDDWGTWDFIGVFESKQIVVERVS